MHNNPTACLLCGSHHIQSNQLDSGAQFWGCSHCGYVFKSPEYRLDKQGEQQRYLEHNNDLEDPRYLEYLGKTFDKIRHKLTGQEKIVDYGCGPTKGLSQLLKDTQFQVVSFDPIFYPEALEPVSEVDVIFCSEAIEHAYEPIQVFEAWSRLLKPEGLITLRTSFHPGLGNLQGWWYLDDPTHVGFFNETTWEWLAKKFRWEILHMHSPYASFSYCSKC